MGAIPYALSVTHFVNSVGAKAGFAAIIGLALLVLLFFAQMRETASLRDRAAESDEHVRQLEAHVARLSRGIGATTSGPAVVPAPAGVARATVTPAPAGIRTAASGAVAARAAAPPFAPAGVGAPALSSATHAIPSADQNEISIRSNRELAAAAAAGAGGAGVATAAATGGGGDGSASGSHGAGAAVATPPGPRPATAAGGANGSTGWQPPPIPAPAPPPPAMRLSNPAQRQQPRPAGARPAAAAPRRPARAGSSRIRAGLMIAAGVAVLAVIVVVLLNATSGSSNSSSSSGVASSAARQTHHGTTAKTPLKAADVSVTVLNGTQTTNLAHDITQRLAGSGFKTGAPATASDQTLNATVVGYRSHANRSAALMVARSLKLGPASVQPVSQSNLAVACPQTSSCTAQVIVTIGADLVPAGGTTTAAGSTT